MNYYCQHVANMSWLYWRTQGYPFCVRVAPSPSDCYHIGLSTSFHLFWRSSQYHCIFVGKISERFHDARQIREKMIRLVPTIGLTYSGSGFRNTDKQVSMEWNFLSFKHQLLAVKLDAFLLTSVHKPFQIDVLISLICAMDQTIICNALNTGNKAAA